MANSGNGNAYIDPSDASTYANNNTEQRRQADKFVGESLPLIRGPALDVGCGDGAVTNHVSVVSGQKIVGMDISSQRIQEAQATYGSKIAFFVGDIVNKNSAGYHHYNTVVSFNTLHHIPEDLQRQVFFNIRNFLSDSGVAVLMIAGRSSSLHDAIRDTAYNDRWSTWFQDFQLSKVRTYQTPSYYQALCIQSGFYACKVTARTHVSKPLNFEQMQGFLSGWLPHLAHLILKNANEDVKNQFLKDIVSLYFSISAKKETETVTTEILQNHVIAFATRRAFFRYVNHSEKKEAFLFLPQVSAHL